jgi:tRNA(adenine34) deaminase
MFVTPEFIDRLMESALAQARAGEQGGEVPVGAVIALDATVVAAAHNETEATNDATAHAEILAIRRAGAATNSWRLERAILCVTIEPCTMCVGALILARIPLVIFGAEEPCTGALGSLYDLSYRADGRELFRTIRGVRRDACAELVRRFFVGRR